MEATETDLVTPGLRERKKQQTRDTIARVALQLFAERGYEQTTLAEIADAANVSKRTIFAYFESKEDILFCDEPKMFDRLEEMLKQRPPGTTTVDALREFLASVASPDENTMLRKRIVATDEGLRRSERARTARVEQMIAESIAKDLDAGPDDVRPPLIAASVTAAFTTVSDRLASESGEPISHEQTIAILDEVLEFLRGGLEGLRAADRRAGRRTR
jgi:AcrR family transcriptional regulator